MLVGERVDWRVGDPCPECGSYDVYVMTACRVCAECHMQWTSYGMVHQPPSPRGKRRKDLVAEDDAGKDA